MQKEWCCFFQATLIYMQIFSAGFCLNMICLHPQDRWIYTWNITQSFYRPLSPHTFQIYYFLIPSLTSSAANQGPRILTGNLPEDFLRIDNQSSGMQMWPQQQMIASGAAGFLPTYYQKGGMLTATIAQVKITRIKTILWSCLKVNLLGSLRFELKCYFDFIMIFEVISTRLSQDNIRKGCPPIMAANFLAATYPSTCIFIPVLTYISWRALSFISQKINS